MNRKVLYKIAYVLDLAAVALFVLALLSNAYEINATHKLYSVYEIINEGSSMGYLISITVSTLAIILAIGGLFVALKNKKLGQGFITAGIVYVFAHLNASILTLENAQYQTQANGSGVEVELLQKLAGYNYCLYSFIAVAVASLFMFLASLIDGEE